jgi:hypothetical protein
MDTYFFGCFTSPDQGPDDALFRLWFPFLQRKLQVTLSILDRNFGLHTDVFSLSMALSGSQADSESPHQLRCDVKTPLQLNTTP